MMELVPQSRAARITISVFIVFTALAVVLTDNSQFAGDNAAIKPVMVVLNSYARYTRLMQRWALFTPEPRRYVIRYIFKIQFRDGSVGHWHRPYPPKWGFFARYHASDWQKFDTAASHMENPALWPDIGRWIARKFANPANPPVKIQLIANIAKTPPPQGRTGNKPLFLNASEFQYQKQVVFTYDATRDQIQPVGGRRP